MSGHSKWSNIKHKKEKTDKNRGKEFTRLSKEIINAVKQGGPDPSTNVKLKNAILKAKASNLPNENIQRNIKKASSSSQKGFMDLTYEVYGYEGVGIVAQIMTDNKNRISSEMNIIMNKCGGNVAQQGSVIFNFEKKGVIQIEKKSISEDDLFAIVVNANVDDFIVEEDVFIIITNPADLYKVNELLEKELSEKELSEKKEIKIISSNLEEIAKSYIKCSKEAMEKNIVLIERIEELDDVDAVFHNMELE